ncbi:GspH/FimT family pseudopilin [Pseudoalteromonas sp. MMG010]|uniref:GspH/FimT family pseudopilin n=1 Tax=Pseudoalteromonas sp. MMG010 TaxID=2822685 RepID=UPI001B3A1414|nr:GspH/FimT family pseudopilin [Pseudoalteromonas sp. MMG010]MBQ4833058.1 GspH/FimT family pseudopilin [Pseudoalteromonas sp. MMG010]
MKLIPTHFIYLGFTLIEVFFVIIILSILTSLSFTYFSDFLAKNRLDSQISLLHKTISLSRLYAIKNSNFITLCSLHNERCEKDNWHLGVTAFIDNDKSQTRSASEQIIYTFSQSNPQDTLTYPRTAITFRPDGSVNGLNNGTFLYCPSYKKASLEGLAITVSPIGRVRVKSTDLCQQ